MTFGRGLGIIGTGVLAIFVAGAPSAMAGTNMQPDVATAAWCIPASAEAHSGNTQPGDARVSDANPRMRRVAEKLARKETLMLVAIGSSSTEGSDLHDRSQAYPSQLERQLNARFGANAVRVINRGRGGETIPDTVARFASDVEPAKPDLVVWQLGANDIVRKADPLLTERGVDHGMAQLQAMGVPVVMMDTQSAAAVHLSPMLEPIQTMLKQAAKRHGALFWSRMDVMRGILATRKASDSDLIKADNLHMTVAMHACTGKLLGDAIAEHVTRSSASSIVSAQR
ncbi:MAG: SGNH/GDSL hydrolase family protein [Bosea sp. (in: a-proteobacteria)]